MLKTITYIPVPLRALAKLGYNLKLSSAGTLGYKRVRKPRYDTRLLAEMTRLVEHIKVRC
jgi:hypothetical protein